MPKTDERERNPYKPARARLRKPKRFSLRMIANRRETHIPAHWILDEDLSAIANGALAEFVFSYAKPTWRVFVNSSMDYNGRCFFDRRFIVLRPDTTLHTFAHEIAHVKFHGHTPSHARLTLEIEPWLKRNWMRFV